MRLPNDTQRHNIYGKTGSGKTVAGLWALEKRSFRRMPWVIVDTKRDGLIDRIPRLEEVDIRHKPPHRPGLYVVRPFPDDEEPITEFFWKVWRQGNTGLFIDEAAMIGRFNKAYDAICTQGRSLHIPLIQLSQRPSWLARYAMSEADFHQVFYIQNPADIAKLEDWVPAYLDTLKQNHHSYYYDVAKDDLAYLRPVPPEHVILQRFEEKMSRRVRLFSGWFNNAEKGEARLTA